MKFPAFKKLYYTDFKDGMSITSLVQQLSLSLNPALSNLFSALNNNLTLADNLAVTIATITAAVDSSGNPTTATSFAIANSNTISGTQVIKATNNTSATVYPTGGIFISYTQSGSQITVNNITGLPANNQFTLSIVAYLT